MSQRIKITRNLLADDGPTTDLHIPDVLSRSTCYEHDALAGVPCYMIPNESDYGYHIGICNKRAIAAGKNGIIDPRSLTRKPFGRPDAKRN